MTLIDINKTKTIQEFLNSDENKVFSNIHRLKRNLKILERNFQELNRKHNEVLLRLDNLDYWSSSKPHKRNNDHIEITRLIINYLASAKTLFGSSRSYNKLITNSIFKDDFENFKNGFSSDPKVKFLLDLRNFLTHKGYIDFGFKRIINIGIKNIFIYLDKEHLKNYQGWTQESKEFISNSKTQIEILQLIEDFHSRIKILNDWLYFKLLTIKKDEIQLLQNQTQNLIDNYEIKIQYILSLNKYIKKINKLHGQ